MARIYVASSWRNRYQPTVVRDLRAAGHAVYDFRNPAPGNEGFRWSDIDPTWEEWGPMAFRSALSHPIAEQGFAHDFDAMRWADTGILLLPSGRSAHLEAGYFTGAGKPLYILLGHLWGRGGEEAELMYRMATGICIDMDELLAAVGEAVPV